MLPACICCLCGQQLRAIITFSWSALLVGHSPPPHSPPPTPPPHSQYVHQIQDNEESLEGVDVIVYCIFVGVVVILTTVKAWVSALNNMQNIHRIIQLGQDVWGVSHIGDSSRIQWRVEPLIYFSSSTSLFFPLSSFLSHFSPCQNDWWWPAEQGVRHYTSYKWLRPARPGLGPDRNQYFTI